MKKSEKKLPWMKWFWGDWRSDPGVRQTSLEARALWFEMIGLMSDASPYGHLIIAGKPLTPKGLSFQVGGGLTAERAVELLKELVDNGVADVTDEGVIYSRRMIRDREAEDARAEQSSINGKKGGNPRLKRGSVPKDQRVRPFKRSDNPAKTRRIFEGVGGCCRWCGVELSFDTFHVDHVIPICDGGTNDEDNLTAACPACNHARARVDYRPDTNPTGSSRASSALKREEGPTLNPRS